MLSFTSFALLSTGLLQNLNDASAAIIPAIAHVQPPTQLRRRVDAFGSSELSLQDPRDTSYSAPM
jgi:hypothetical protein